MLTNKALYIIQTGQTFTDIAEQHGDFDALISHGLLVHAQQQLTIKTISAFSIDVDSFKWPAPEDCAGVIISGSHDMVTDEKPWMVALGKWVRKLTVANVPLLGICFGHQLLAKALGGKAGKNPNGLELGSVPIHLSESAKSDVLFHDFSEEIVVHTVHYQSALTLPEGAVVLASNAHDPHHAFRIGEHCWGVQFHPEFNQDVMHGYIFHLSQTEKLKGSFLVSETRESFQLLQRFRDYVYNLKNKAA